MVLSHERFLKVLALLRDGDATETEQRRHPRVSVRALVLIAPCVEEPTPLREPELGGAYTVRVQDLSCEGVGVQHFHPLAKGKSFVLDLPERGEGGEMGSVRILCRVTHCRTTNQHHYQIGAQFVRLWTAAAPSLEAARAATD
jgi:hypothetical protein